MDEKLTSLLLPRDLHTRLKVVAAKNRKTIKVLVMEAILEKLKQEE